MKYKYLFHEDYPSLIQDLKVISYNFYAHFYALFQTYIQKPEKYIYFSIPYHLLLKRVFPMINLRTRQEVFGILYSAGDWWLVIGDWRKNEDR